MDRILIELLNSPAEKRETFNLRFYQVYTTIDWNMKKKKCECNFFLILTPIYYHTIN